MLGAHVLARVTALRQGRGAGGTRFGLASVLSTRHLRPVERDSAWRRKAESEFALGSAEAGSGQAGGRIMATFLPVTDPIATVEAAFAAAGFQDDAAKALATTLGLVQPMEFRHVAALTISQVIKAARRTKVGRGARERKLSEVEIGKARVLHQVCRVKCGLPTKESVEDTTPRSKRPISSAFSS